MKKFLFNTLVLIGFLLLNLNIVSAAEYITPKKIKGSPSNLKNLESVMLSLDPFVLNPFGDFYAYTYRGVRVDLTLGEYNSNGFVTFGTPGVVKKASGQVNDRKGSEYRFLGMSNDGYTPVTNFEFPDDIPTDGNTAGRKYVYDSWTKRNSLTASFRPGPGDFNKPSSVRFNILEQRRTAGYISAKSTDADAQRLIDTWLRGIYDRYQRDHAYYKKTSKFWDRSSSRTDNEFLEMSPSKLRRIAYIAMPPTMYTYGVANTYYACGSVSSTGYCYDVHWIDPVSTHTSLAKPNLVATSLKAKAVNPLYYEVNFSAKNDEDVALNANVYSRGRYRIGGGAWQAMSNPMDAVRHGSNWSQNKVNNAVMGGVYVPPGTPEGTPIDLEVEINPVRGGSRVVNEGTNNYGDNIKRLRIYTDEQSMCMTGGAGTSRTYGNVYCSKTEKLPDGTTVCTGTSCSYSTYYLNNTAMVDYETSKQTLLGVWSKNRRAHSDDSVPEARDAEIKNDQFSIKMSGDFANQLKKMGVDPKRTIRAGRSVQMYGTVEVELNLSSFLNEADLERKKNEFMGTLVNTLKTKGVRVDGNDAVKNNKGQTTVAVELDNDRRSTKIDGVNYAFRNNTEGYMYKQAGNLVTDYYGDSACRRIVVYKKTYKFVIPVKTKNEGGTQKTSQGDFVSKKSYNSSDAEADFVTNINNKNGMYGLEFNLGMNRKALDPTFSGTQLCRSTKEEFKIDGNIFDDVRSEDESDEIEKDRENWDF